MTRTPHMPSWHLQLVADLKRDRKRTGLLAVLAIVAVFVVGRLILASSGPSKVTASSIVAKPDGDVPAGHIDDPTGEINGDSHGRFDAAARLPITRDLFASNERFFPKVQPKPQASEGPGEAPGGRKDPVELRRAIRDQARALKLQCTVGGATPTAIINGMMVAEGAKINGFTVRKITARAVTVEKESITLTLSMKDNR